MNGSAKKGLPQRNCYVNVLRDACLLIRSNSAASTLAQLADRLHRPMQVTAEAHVRDLPAVLSVEAQTLS
jgi:hypothetical protein